ncbi:MAG: MFS transporter [bacterium]|nr:MFS transporter [bacterium]
MLWLAHLGFLAFGSILVIVGSTQAALSDSLGIGLEGTGGLAAAVSLGLGFGVVAAGPLTDRFPRRPLFVGAALIAALGLVQGAAGTDVWQVGLGLSVAGMGAGFFETILNTVVAEIDPLRAERRLVSVHAAATLGAVLSPPLLAMLSTASGFAQAFHACAAGFVVLAALGGITRFPRLASSAQAESSSGSGTAVWGFALLPLMAASAAYVGFETALTAFAPALALAGDLSPGRGVAAISAFWLGLLAGRLGFLVLGRSAGANWLMLAGLLATLALGIGVAVDLRALELGFGALGFVLGAVFPILIAVTARRFPERRATALGLVAGAGSLGGVLVPWLGGRVGDRIGLAGTWVVLIGCCLLLALGGAMANRRSPK